jgi:heat shock protein HslJ
MQNDPSQKSSNTNPLVWVLVAMVVLVLILGAGIIYMLSLRPISQVATTPESTATSLPSSTMLPPTETPVPATATSMATSLPPTPTPISGDPAVVLGRPSGLDTFDTANNWTLYDNTCFKADISGGVFVMNAKGLPQVSCWEVSWPVIQNYYAETLVQMPATCQAEDRFGLFFRSPDNLSGYLFGLTCDGRYTMTAWDGQTTTVLVEPVANAAILTGPGKFNRVGVVASGGAYALYANGTLLQVLQDYSFTEAGRLGFYVRAATEAGFTVQYDNLAVWLLEPLLPGSTTGQLASTIATSVASTPGLIGTRVPGSTPPAGLTPQPTYPPAFTQTLTPVYSDDLVGSAWSMYRLPGTDGDSVTMEDPDKYTVRFNSDGTLDVKSDCNTGEGVYKLRSDNRITIDLTSGTTKDCGSDSYSALFFERLESASTYELDGDEMSLSLSSGGSMDFAR